MNSTVISLLKQGAPPKTPKAPFCRLLISCRLGIPATHTGSFASPPICDSSQVATSGGTRWGGSAGSGPRRLLVVAQCGDPVLQRSQADPQHFGGAFAIAAYVFEREFDVGLLEFHERLARLEVSSALMVG